MIGSEEEILAAIARCLEECHRAQVFSQLQVKLDLMHILATVVFSVKALCLSKNLFK